MIPIGFLCDSHCENNDSYIIMTCIMICKIWIIGIIICRMICIIWIIGTMICII